MPILGHRVETVGVVRRLGAVVGTGKLRNVGNLSVFFTNIYYQYFLPTFFYGP